MDKRGPIFSFRSDGPCLTWLWSIEYLSSFPHLDLSIVPAPVSPDESGENTTERVALRCLKELIVPENVLLQILQEVKLYTIHIPISALLYELQVVLKYIASYKCLYLSGLIFEPEKGWTRAFIMHKKALLPKCSLEQLKGDIKKFDCLHGDKQMEDESGITIKVTKIDGWHLGYDSQAGEGEEDVHVATRTFEHPCMDQLCENEDERLNIAMKRSLFVSSQSRPSKDPVGKAGPRKQNLCVKCNLSGKVLICGSSDSAVAVHRSCLGSTARYDDKGNFLCPFCACSLSNSKHFEGKDRIILARKHVVALVELC
ncbi:PHD finger 21B [Gossypium australe]|uniref:PHD finger 21B n=1 Tax=Gossypium australe TaxID=47621 RepID=A0A5B6UZ68_9ROSI|nr:PHD finger 21B [Gossypium australe]